MACPLSSALDELATIAAKPEHASALLEQRADFAKRTGAFGPEDPWFEARSRAFWDWVVTRGGFAARAKEALSERARPWSAPFARAHRGLFVVVEAAPLTLRDLLGGAEFVVEELDAGLRDAMAVSSAPFDGLLVAHPPPEARVGLLPGAVFHPESAAQAIGQVVAEAKKRGTQRDALLDALLRMERSLRSLSRVKASFCYRVEAL